MLNAERNLKNESRKVAMAQKKREENLRILNNNVE